MKSQGVEIPEALGFLFTPSRYKVAYGGRGSAKSWSVARALIYLAARSRIRVLCGREVQRSIKDSVHRLLTDQISIMGLDGRFQVLETEIRGANGSLFLFAGLSTQSIESIKSYEGVDICWIEEGQVVTKRSWDILIPTIRKEGSEIWITMNPELETDETAQRFVVNPPPDAIVRKINYVDNPWFPDVLEAERVHCKLTDPRGYPNIWEGDFKPAAEGAIYYDEMASAQSGGRIRAVPYDPALLAHTVWDLGFNDSMSVIVAQVLGSEIRVIDYIEDSLKPITNYVAALKEKRYVWGTDWLPHDGFARDLSGNTAADILSGLGRSVGRVPNIGIEPGIKAARSVFPRVYFDSVRCARLIESLKRYRRAVPVSTNEPAMPLHDEYSHGADAFRYLALSASLMCNEQGYDGMGWQDVGRSAVGGY